MPDQKWIDGIAINAGKVRQFVAMPMGTGYSVEAQMTGEEVTGGIQFEFTPCEIQITVAIEGQILDLSVSENDHLPDLLKRLERKIGMEWTEGCKVYRESGNRLDQLLCNTDLRSFGIRNVCRI